MLLLLWRLLLLLLLLLWVEVASSSSSSSWHRPVDRTLTGRRRRIPVGRGHLLHLGVTAVVSSAATSGTRISVGATRRGRSGGKAKRGMFKEESVGMCDMWRGNGPFYGHY